MLVDGDEAVQLVYQVAAKTSFEPEGWRALADDSEVGADLTRVQESALVSAAPWVRGFPLWIAVATTESASTPHRPQDNGARRYRRAD